MPPKENEGLSFPVTKEVQDYLNTFSPYKNASRGDLTYTPGLGELERMNPDASNMAGVAITPNQLFNSQDPFEVAGRAFKGFGVQMGAGFMKALGSWDVNSIYNMAAGNTDANYSNWANDIADDLLDYAQRELKIHQDPSGSIWNGAYLGQQLQSAGLTGGILLEAMLEQALLAMAAEGHGGSLNVLSMVRKSKLLKSLLFQGAFGLKAGVQEAYINALETSANVYQTKLNHNMELVEAGQMTLEEAEEDARLTGNKAATLNWRTEVGPLMVLNALQFAGTLGTGLSSSFESGTDFLTKGIKNKYVRGATRGLLMPVFEGFEEGMQSIYQTYASNTTFEGEGLDQYKKEYFGQEFRDNVIGGIIGGGMMGVGGKVMGKVRDMYSNKNLRIAQDAFLAEGKERIFNSFDKKQKAEEEFIRLSEVYADNPTIENRSKRDEAKHKFEQSQLETHIGNAQNALYLDSLRNDTRAFESHIEQLQNSLDAVNNNDDAKLSTLGLLDSDGNEVFEGSKDFIKSNFQNYIDYSNSLKSKLEHNIMNMTSDFQSAWDISVKQVNNDNLSKQIISNDAKITENYNSNSQFNLLSPQGKSRYLLEQEKLVLETLSKSGNFSQINQNRLDDINSQLENEEEYSVKDKIIEKSIANQDNQILYFSSALSNNDIERNSKELVEDIKQENIQKKIKKRLDKQKEEKISQATSENKEEIKKEIEQDGNIVTDEDNAKIEEAAFENDTKGNMKSGFNEAVLDNFDPSQLVGSETIINEDGKESKQEFESSFSFQPIMYDDTNQKHNQLLESLTNGFKIADGISMDRNGKNVSVNDLFNFSIDRLGLSTIEVGYNIFEKALEQANIPHTKQELKDLYEDTFGRIFSGLDGVVGNVVSTQKESVQTSIQQEKKEIKEEQRNKLYEQDIVEYNGPKTAEAIDKFAFKAVGTKQVQLDTGEYVTHDEDVLLRDGEQDVDAIVNYENFKEGDKFVFEMRMDWVSPEGYTKDNNFEKWIESVPVDVIYDGKNRGPLLHSVNWWKAKDKDGNYKNVADFRWSLNEHDAKIKQAEVITAASLNHLNNRTFIYNNGGVANAVISKRTNNFESRTPSFKSISESAPDVRIAYLEYGNNGPELYVGTQLVEDNVEVLSEYTENNEPKRLSPGTTMMITQVGVDNNGNPMYKALSTVTNPSDVVDNRDIPQENLGKLERSKGRIYEILNVIRGTSNAIPVEKAEDIINQISSELSKVHNKSQSKIKKELLSSLGASNYLSDFYPKKDNNGKWNLTYQGKGEKINLPLIDENFNLSFKPYSEVVKEHIYTQHKFFEFNKEDGSKGYTMYPQPKIEYVIEGVNLSSNEVQQFIPNQDKEVPSTSSEDTVSYDMAADYLLTGGFNTLLSTDYLLRGIAGVFGNAIGLIDSIRTKYAREIGAKGLEQIKDFVGSDLYNKVVAEIREALNQSYSDNEVQNILNDILKHPTGMPNRLGNEIESRINSLSTVQNITKEEAQVNLEQQKEIEVTQEPVEELSNEQENLIKNEMFNIALKDIFDVITEDNADDIRSLSKVIIDSYYNHLENKKVFVNGKELPFQEAYPETYKYLKEHGEEILGYRESKGKLVKVNDYSSLLSMVESFINQELDEIIDQEGFNEKTNDRASFEVSVKNTLSLKAKLLLAGSSILPNHKTVTKPYAGFNQYYNIDVIYDGLQQVLANNPNDLFSMERRIREVLVKNPKEFGFLENVLDTIKKAPKELQKQLLYRLNQTKVNMYMTMYNDQEQLRTLNANSKDPYFVTLDSYKNSLKRSPLVSYTKDGFVIDTKIAENLMNQFQQWRNKPESVSTVEFANWLSHFGITPDIAVIEDYLKPGENNKNRQNFGPNESLHGVLYSTLEKAVKYQNNQKKTEEDFVFRTSFDKNIPFSKLPGSKSNFNNLLTYNSSKFLKDFINRDISMSFHTLKSMYISGKSIYSYSQPNFASLQTDKLKSSDSSLLRDNLLKTAFSKNNLLLNLISEAENIKKDNPNYHNDKDLLNKVNTSDRIRQSLGISYVSLNPLKQQGQPSYNEDGITQLYSGDREATFLGMFVSDTAYYGEINGFNYRGARMSSPALSDSSQVILLDAPVLDLKKSNFTFDEQGNIIGIEQDLLDLMYSQFVLPDINRMEEFLKAQTSTNTVGQDFASQVITVFHALNGLKYEDSFLLRDLHQAIDTNKPVEDVIALYKGQIDYYLESYFLDLAKSKFEFSKEGSRGDWVDYGFYTPNEETGGSISIIDREYLDKRDGETIVQNLSIASLDYVINYAITQSHWQTLFAGDYSNYFKELKDIEDGGPFKLNAQGIPQIFALGSTSDISTTLPQIISKQEESAKISLSKRLKELISPGNRLANSYNNKETFNRNYYQIMISDVDSPSTIIKNLVELRYGKLTKEQNEKIDNLLNKIKEYRESEYTNNSKAKSLYKEIYGKKGLISELQSDFPLVASYFNITGTDAQEYTTWREHLNVLEQQGNVSSKIIESIKKKLVAQSEGAIKGNELTEEERDVIFQPIKPLYTGMHFDNINGFQNQKFVYVKTSSFPLLPELTKGNTALNGVRNNMEKLEKEGKPVRASYQSGNKVGALKNTISFERLSNPETSIEEIRNSSLKMDRTNFSIQQDKPYKTDSNIKKGKRDEVTRATQFEDIILGNGINHITKKIFPNILDKKLLDEIRIEESDMLSGQELYKAYNYVYEKEQNLLKQKLYRDLNLDEKGTWGSSVESVKAVKKLLKDQLTNQQDIELVEIMFVVNDGSGERLLTERQLANENSARRNNLQDTLTPIRGDFRFPLWMMPNSNKLESVFNAFVTNRLIRNKQVGFSSPVASEQGFTFQDEDQYSKEGILYTDAYEGELKATYIDGVLHKAQVLVQSKFRGADGKLLDLPTKEIKDENGKTRIVLDTEKIDKSLLSMFSFRIPTSSHQSGAIIEIVGFLPHNQGDLMIVPKDHATQLGEDYDIDTRYVYGYNTIVDSTGMLRKLTYEDIPQVSNKSPQDVTKEYRELKRELINSYNTDKSSIWYENKEKIVQLYLAESELRVLNNVGSSVNNFIDSIFGVNTEEDKAELQKEIDSLVEEIIPVNQVREKQKSLQLELQALLDSLKVAYGKEHQDTINSYISQKYVDKMEIMVLENQISNIFTSVYTTTDKDIQKSISATLSTDFAEETAKLIDEVVSSNNSFSIYDSRHQDKMMMLGASGKIGIGVHSNWVVLNSLFQQINPSDRPQLIRGYDEDGNPIPMEMTLGKFNIEGKLGLTTMEELHRVSETNTISITEANMINQNSSTDNQKLQIMGKRNENKFTIGVMSLMYNLGIISDKLGNKDVGYPDLFISQPIIRRYVELKSKYSGIITGYVENRDGIIKAQLISEFGDGVKWATNKEGEILVGRMDKKEMNTISPKLTAQRLFDNLLGGDNIVQWAVFEKFMEFEHQVQEVNKLQQLMNIEGQALGRGFMDVIDKKNKLSKNISIHNANRMLGERKTTSSIETKKELEQDGYMLIDTYANQNEVVYTLMKPTTLQNRKLINSTSIAYNLWKNIFPYENTAIADQIQTITNLIKRDGETELSNKKRQDVETDVLIAVRDFFYSFKSNNSIFEKSLEEERRDLFLGNKGKLPLAVYLFNLSDKNRNGGQHPLFQEAFFKDLSFNIGTQGQSSTIEYSLNEMSNFNKNEVYKILEQLSNNNTPIEEGSSYTYAELIKDLTKYSLLANQEKGAIGFRQYIPVSVLEKYNVVDDIRLVSNVTAITNQSKLLNGFVKHLTSSMRIVGDRFTMQGSSKEDIENLNKAVKQINNTYGEMSLRVTIEDTSNNILSGRIDTFSSLEDYNKGVFLKQFYQHNPKYAPQVSTQGTGWYQKSGSNLLTTRDKGFSKPFIRIHRSKTKQELYEYIAPGIYKRIETLGEFGVNEYSPFNMDATSIFENNKFQTKDEVIVSPIIGDSQSVIKNDILAGEKNLQQMIADIASTKESKYSEAAKFILPFIQNKKINIVNLDTESSAGGYLSGYPGNTTKLDSGKTFNQDEIYLNKDSINVMSPEELRYLLLEEALHSVTATEIDKYIDSSKTFFNAEGKLEVSWINGFNTSNAPVYVTKLLSIYEQAIRHKLKSLEGGNITQEQQIEQLNNSAIIYPGGIKTINRLLNLKEFIIGVTVDPIFKEEMSKVEYNGKTLLSKVAQAIKQMFQKIATNLGIKNSISETGFNAVMVLLESNMNKSTVVNKKPVSVDKVIEKAEKLSNEVPSNNIENNGTINTQEYSNHSGGAKGGDTYWDKIGKKFGFNNHNHYTTNYYDKLSDNVKNLIEERYKNAVKFLGRGTLVANSYAGKLVRRDMIQAQNADAIYGITELVAPGEKGRKGYNNKMNYSIPEGGTGYAVASGILQNKPTYVFNQSDKYGNEIGWYKWDNNSKDFIKVKTPVLSKKYAGIGTTEINDLGIQAIQDVYEKTINNGTPEVNLQPNMKTSQIINVLLSNNILTKINCN